MSNDAKFNDFVDLGVHAAPKTAQPLLRGRVVPVTKPRLPRKSKPGKASKPRGKSLSGVTLGDAAWYGKQAWGLAKHLATLINVEEKVLDIDGTSGLTVTSTPTVINLTNIAQGNDYFNRSGDSVLGQSIEFRARLSGNPATIGNWCRVLIVVDKEQRGTDPVMGDVLQGGTAPDLQPLNALTAQRFTVLYDELAQVDNIPDLATGGTSTAYISGRTRLPNMVRKHNSHIRYGGTTAADASNLEGAMYLMLVSGDASNGPVFRYTWRYKFTDN